MAATVSLLVGTTLTGDGSGKGVKLPDNASWENALNRTLWHERRVWHMVAAETAVVAVAGRTGAKHRIVSPTILCASSRNSRSDSRMRCYAPLRVALAVMSAFTGVCCVCVL